MKRGTTSQRFIALLTPVRLALSQLWPDLLWSRVALVSVGVMALAFLPWMYVSPTYNLSRDPLVLMFTRWDAMWYIDIARRGYWFKALAFFPLYPAAIAGLRWLTDMSAAWSAILISNAALVGVMVVFWLLVREHYGERLASQTTRCFLLFPTAFFLSAAYTESLFLLLVLLTFWLAERRQLWAAGLTGFLAALTRNQGVLLIVPLIGAYAQLAWGSPEPSRLWRWVRADVLAVAGPAAGLLAFAVWQGLVFHRAGAFLAVQAAWGRVVAPPWVGIVAAIGRVISGEPLQASTVLSMMDLLAALAFLGLIVVGVRQRLPWSWLVFSGAAWLMDVSAPALGGESPLLSMTRLVLVLFPGFVSLAMLTDTAAKPGAGGVRAGTLGTMVPWVFPMFQAMFFAIFATWRWVA